MQRLRVLLGLRFPTALAFFSPGGCELDVREAMSKSFILVIRLGSGAPEPIGWCSASLLGRIASASFFIQLHCVAFMYRL